MGIEGGEVGVAGDGFYKSELHTYNAQKLRKRRARKMRGDMDGGEHRNLVLVLLVSALAIAAAVFHFRWRRSKKRLSLPPGPSGWPLVGNLFQVVFSGKPFMYVVRDLREQFGSIFTLKMGQKTLIIITSPELAHEALVEKGTLFASRPPDTPTKLLFSANKFSVNSAEYGPFWRALRRNLVSEMLNLNRVKDFSWIREWAMDRLVDRLQEEAARSPESSVKVLSNIRFSIFSILLCMCFGARLGEDVITRVDKVMKDILVIVEPQIHDFLPLLAPLFFKRWKRIKELRRTQIDSILPLINRRRSLLKERNSGWEPEGCDGAHAYIDSLINLEVEGREKPTDEELVTLCSELLTAGTDTTATALEWALARMVMHPDIQGKVHDEILRVVGNKRKVTDADVEHLPYLNAVVKETLRRHPPGHFVLSHAATHDCQLRGYDIPAKANVEFYTASVSFDPHIWPNPMEFNPDRFLDPENDVDITGSKHVKMMPFGVGRRICPALGLGTLHINLILARMVQAFLWSPSPAQPPDLTEMFAFTVVMKNPLHASISKRAP
ncbi:hypothetical protein SUGI_1045460 [Cryptomeria japonica]|uniref:cytochrome P450 77A1 n=1 Tax=Cryptomeria japonica TaxID=3369 RepID=UPI0024149444|nr:cytochrome P450 77A1 [Cryptomeria japonica]GLJ49399.1 hypothetical protein SUGI_1045460 [Cryptomeria japonica]